MVLPLIDVSIFFRIFADTVFPQAYNALKERLSDRKLEINLI